MLIHSKGIGATLANTLYLVVHLDHTSFTPLTPVRYCPGGKLLILQAYDPPNPAEFDALIDEGMASEHLPSTDAFWEGVRVRGRKLAQIARQMKPRISARARDALDYIHLFPSPFVPSVSFCKSFRAAPG